MILSNDESHLPGALSGGCAANGIQSNQSITKSTRFDEREWFSAMNQRGVAHINCQRGESYHSPPTWVYRYPKKGTAMEIIGKRRLGTTQGCLRGMEANRNPPLVLENCGAA